MNELNESRWWRAAVLAVTLVGCTPEVVEGPLEGPGLEEETGELIVEGEQFLVALTHLQVKNAPGPGGRFGDHANAIGTWLFENEPEGWVGAAFRNRGQLNWWTMTVWESEEAMHEFVLSDLHAAAMADLSSVSVGAESMHKWMDREELPLAWSTALEILREEPGFVYGDSKWFAGEL